MFLAACLVLLLSASLVPFPATAQGTCGPSPLGPPCGQGGLAVSAVAEPQLSLGAGNPIHLVTGNKYQLETDLPANPDAPGIEVVRHYNAMDRRVSPLGQGWTLSYDTRLYAVGGRWQIVQADGSRIAFSGASGMPLPHANGVLSFDGARWRWTWPNGRRLYFDIAGHLVRIHAPGRYDLDIRRHTEPGPLKGSVNSVINDRGQALHFHYRVVGNQVLLDHIDTPLGRYSYRYATAETTASHHPASVALVQRPDGMQRLYFYEPERQADNRHALTGIGIRSSDGRHTARLNTWAYDAQGRAVLSVAGPPDSNRDRLTLHFEQTPTSHRDGLTRIIDAGRGETQVHTALKAGRHVVTRVLGHGCTGCAAPGSEASYDAQGRLHTLNHARLVRDGAGTVQALHPDAPGWPGLHFRYHANGLRQSWASSLSGTEAYSYDSRRFPVQRRFANGDTVDYGYDAQGRPVRLTARNTRGDVHETVLAWRGGSLVSIAHPHENEHRQYDAQGRLAQRRIQRVPAHAGASPYAYTESFQYDDQHRLTHHHLPEGGTLHYRWSPDHRLETIAWQDAAGAMHTVIDSQPGIAGYRYANGLHLHTRIGAQQQAHALIVSSARGTKWSQWLRYDQNGRLQAEHHTAASGTGTDTPSEVQAQTWHYAYDHLGRMTGAQAGQASPIWYAWHADGSLVAQRNGGITRKPSVQRDASGLPRGMDGYRLRYSPGRRLAEVRRNGTLVAQYRHNAFGHRIARSTPDQHTDYFYLDNRVVAERTRPVSAIDAISAVSDTANAPAADISTTAAPHMSAAPHSTDGPAFAVAPAGAEGPFSIQRRYIYAQHVPVGFIDYAEGGQRGTLYAVHADLLGAPRLVTDMQGRVRWMARYSPTGQAERVAGNLTLDLRLPGQLFDAATGWNDNVLRTYLPDAGHYLEPDPLGPVPHNDALGYARQQPRRYVDPLGLLLFAFDGTRHSPATRSNVWKLTQAYQDGPVFYRSGPGNSQQLDWDAVTAWQASRIIDAQWRSLLDALHDQGGSAQHIPIDILGFSRGAALARHFGNLINQHVDRGLFSYLDEARGRITACVDLRFMGLFDTVAQFGLAGSHNANYDLGIAAAWEWVAHAVALHERRWMFPVVSAADTGGHNVIEVPFIGAHADIGGGTLYTDEGQPRTRGDLADVSLNWMLWQARAATLRFGTLAPEHRVITEPILHDQRPELLRSVQDGDRSVQDSRGGVQHHYQDEHDRLGRAQRESAEAVIERAENWRSQAGDEVGRVDMTGYGRWLQQELGWQPVPA